MRETALKRLKLAMLAGLCVYTAAASAHPRKVVAETHGHPAARTAKLAAVRHPATEAATRGHGRHAGVSAAAESSLKATGRSGNKKRSGRSAESAAEEVPVSGRGRHGKPVPATTISKGRGRGRGRAVTVAEERRSSRGSRRDARTRSQGTLESSQAALHPASRSLRAATPEQEAEVSQPQSAEPMIAVHHNRKVHHAATPDDAAPETISAVRPIAFVRGGHILMPPAMKGSHEILLHQNRMADEAGLERVQDDEDLLRMRARRDLVAIPVSGALAVDPRLPEDRRFTRPWVAAFLTAAARAHAARFGGELQVNSAVRTVAFQVRLLRTNGNAAPAEGDTASPHLTGQAVDLGKKGMSAAEIGWMRGYLMPLVEAGKIDVEEEFQQACFHISVYPSYAPGLAPQRQRANPVAHVPVVLAAAGMQ